MSSVIKMDIKKITASTAALSFHTYWSLVTSQYFLNKR